MATDIIQAEYQALERIAAQFANEQKRIKGVLQNLHHHHDRLRRGGWIAEAADVFYRDMDNRVLPSLDKLLYALGQSEVTVREIARMMHLAEDDACGGLRSDKTTKGPILKGEIGIGRANLGDYAWAESYKTRYGIGNAAWDAADILTEHVFDKGVGDVAVIGLLNELGLSPNTFGKALPVVGGIVGGLMDYGLEYGDGPFDGAALLTQVSSGALQGLVSMTGVGTVVMGANTAVQLGGHLVTYGVYQAAEILAGGDPVLADAYRRQANDLNKALDAGNLDNAFDAVTGNIVDMFTGKGTIQQNLGEMASEVGGTVSGVGQIVFESVTMGAVMEAGTIKQAANTIMDSLQIDEGVQQVFNQSADMVMQDIQDLDLADLSSFQRVAERRVDYFRNVFGI